MDFSWLYNKYYYVAKYSATQQESFDAEEGIEKTVFRMLSQFFNIVRNSYEAKVILALDSPTSTLKNKAIF